MKTLGNIIWVVFGGLHIALEYFIAGLIDHHHRHPLRLAEPKTGYAGHLAVRNESEMEVISTRLSELMQINEVDVFQTQTLQHLVKLFRCHLLAILIGPELACYPDGITGNATVLNGLSYAAFVPIGMSRVDVPIACLQSGQHRVVSHFPCGNAVHAKSELRNGNTVIQREMSLILLSFHNRYA